MNAHDFVWNLVLNELKITINEDIVENLLTGIELALLSEKVAVLVVRVEHQKYFIEQLYLSHFKAAFLKVMGIDLDIYVRYFKEGETPDLREFSFTRDINDDTPIQFPPIPEKKEIKKPEIYGNSDDPTVRAAHISYGGDYTFENFIVGNSNKFAHAACTAVAVAPAKDYNPLFIYGPSGMGKTHLLYAIINRIMTDNPGFRYVYVNGEEFTNQMIDSLSRNNPAEFRAKYRNADMLLIDDIQFIAGREATQEEFFHTFNALYNEKKQIIMTSDRPPRDIKTLEDRLKTRFEWGLIADIQPPDFELRIAIMKKKAEMIGLMIPNDVLNFLAENIKSNIRQIEGAVKKIGAQSFLNGVPISIELAKQCIGDFIEQTEIVKVTPDKIIAAVAHKYGFSPDELKGKKRTKELAHARHVAIYIIREMIDMSLPAIGKIFSRDHTTIMSSIDVIENKFQEDSAFDNEIQLLMNDIKDDKIPK